MLPLPNCKNLFLLVLVLFGVALLSPQAGAEKEIPKLSPSFGQPTLSIFYCYSCGYRKAFEEYSNILQEKYPELQVIGGNYDPPGFNMYMSKIILITKLLLIVAIMSSFDIFGYLGQPTPGYWTWCTSNKVYASMMVFFLGNMIEAQLISSGAFEIILNDVPVWSKLQTGRIPAPQELFQIIDSQLQFGKMDTNPDFVK